MKAWKLIAISLFCFSLAACELNDVSPLPDEVTSKGFTAGADDFELDGACGGFALPLVDPITRTDHPYAVRIDYTTNAETFNEGVVYLPGSGRATPAAGPFPVALLLHATGYNHEDYLETQEFLARNGFAVASIDWGPASNANTHALTRMLDHLDYLFGAWTYKDRLQNNIALMGHSRGGKFVPKHATAIEDAGYEVNGMVVMAPAPQSLEDVIVSYPCNSLLVMLAMGDEDPAANGSNKLGGYLEGVETSGFFTYDQAGQFANEFNDFYPAIDFKKMMVYVDEGPHGTFSCTKALGSPTPAKLKEMTRGYLNAYLRSTLRNQTENFAFFKSKTRPASLDASLRLQLQWSSSQRGVVANFSSNQMDMNVAGGATLFENVSVQQGIAPQIVDDARHATGALSVRWAMRLRSDRGRVRFQLSSAEWLGNMQDQSDKTFLSLRVGTVHNSALNDAGIEPDFEVRLKGLGNVESNAVSLSQFGGIPHWNSPRTTLHTVLIPLCEFENVSKGEIVEVELIFGGTDTKGHVLIDNVEFVR